ncbi:MAG TPA: hypothetical protein VFJ51_06045 [Nitrososphaeraceae archaeon]|nr:hypothetical protein [Nitrososphaeraceae archaeon]
MHKVLSYNTIVIIQCQNGTHKIPSPTPENDPQNCAQNQASGDPRDDILARDDRDDILQQTSKTYHSEASNDNSNNNNNNNNNNNQEELNSVKPIVSVDEFFTAEHIPTHELLESPCLPIIGVKRPKDNPNMGYYYCKLRHYPEYSRVGTKEINTHTIDLQVLETHIRYVEPERHKASDY